MRYFATLSGSRARDAMTAGRLSAIITPRHGYRLPPDVEWCADNACYGNGYPGDAAWLAWLDGFPPEERARCAFATAPDVVGDATATLARSTPLLPIIRNLGYPAAFVAQDGAETVGVPWDLLDVLFIGGTTAWKLGPGARTLVTEARTRGKLAHMGRVNSLRRLRYADRIGCHSADGTFLVFGPDRNYPQLAGWLRDVNHPTLIDLEEAHHA